MNNYKPRYLLIFEDNSVVSMETITEEVIGWLKRGLVDVIDVEHWLKADDVNINHVIDWKPIHAYGRPEGEK